MAIRDRRTFGAAQVAVGTMLLLACIYYLTGDDASEWILAVLGFFGFMLVIFGVFTAIGMRIRKGKFTIAGHGAEFELDSEYQRAGVILQTAVEPKTIDEDLKQSRKHFAKDKPIPGRDAPALNIIEDRHHHRLLPISDRMAPMYLLDEHFRIVDWNLAFSLAFDRSMEGRRGLSVLEWVYLLDNYEEVLVHGTETFSDVSELPNIDLESIRFTSLRYGGLAATKRAYRIPDDDGDSTLGWLTILDPRFDNPSSNIKYKADLIRALNNDDLWSEYSISYDRVLQNTNVYNELLNTMVGDGKLFTGIPAGSSVLDLGAGTGNVALRLAESDKDLKIVAVDNNSSMLELLKAKCFRFLREDSTTPGIIAIKQDIETLNGFQDDHFDVVILNNVLYSLADPESCLKHVWRVLKPGGEVRISGPKKSTDLNVLFDRIRADLEQRMVYDKFRADFNHVRVINNLRLRPMLFKWTVADVKRMLIKAGFEPGTQSEEAYAGQAMVLGGQKRNEAFALKVS